LFAVTSFTKLEYVKLFAGVLFAPRFRNKASKRTIPKRTIHGLHRCAPGTLSPGTGSFGFAGVPGVVTRVLPDETVSNGGSEGPRLAPIVWMYRLVAAREGPQ
jgi:hypothetical protein